MKYTNQLVILQFLLLVASSQLSFTQLGSHLQLHSLVELTNIEMDKLKCSTELIQLQKSLSTWEEIIQSQQDLENDIQWLQQIRDQAQNLKYDLEINQSMLELDHFNTITPYQSYRSDEAQEIQQQLNHIKLQTNKEEKEQECDRLDKTLQKYISERKKLQQDCKQSQVTINIINDKKSSISKLSQNCGDKDVEINFSNDENDEDVSQPPSEDIERYIDHAPPKNTLKETIFQEDNLNSPSEYSIGFWFRYLATYPKPLTQEEANQNQFMAKLTDSNKSRIFLGVWKALNNFIMVTQNKEGKEFQQEFNYDHDIEGEWDFIYLSYNANKRKVVAFYDDIKKEFDDIEHPQMNSIKIILGGNDYGKSQIFHGQIYRFSYSVDQGCFIDSFRELRNYIKFESNSPPYYEKMISIFPSDSVQQESRNFSLEYSISGWFKNQEFILWHFDNKVFEVNPQSFSTYSYKQNEQISQNINSQSADQWHFIYFGYSFKKKRAFGFQEEQQLLFKDIHHYLAENYKFELKSEGRDIRLHLANGAYQEGDEFSSFGYQNHKLHITDSNQQYTEYANPNSQYAMTFWIRYLTNHPNRLPNGIENQFYLVAKISDQKDLLGLFQGNGFYRFISFDIEQKQVKQDVPFNGDIEGLWTFVYFSYKSKYQAVGFIKYGPEGQTFKVELPSQHPDASKMLKLQIGDPNEKNSFNGQFRKIKLISDSGCFKEESIDIPKLEQVDIGRIIKQIDEGLTDYKSREFVEEYSISGWFKSDDRDHFLFRMSIYDESVNEGYRLLGDRVLFSEIDDQMIRFSTYSYHNVHAQGKPNIMKKVKQSSKRSNWYFIYFGYSRKMRKARVFYEEDESEQDLEFDKINHYPTNRLYVYVGQDIYNKHKFKGSLGLINVIIGESAFTQSKDFEKSNPLDPFNYQSGPDQQEDDEEQTQYSTKEDDGKQTQSSAKEDSDNQLKEKDSRKSSQSESDSDQESESSIDQSEQDSGLESELSEQGTEPVSISSKDTSLYDSTSDEDISSSQSQSENTYPPSEDDDTLSSDKDQQLEDKSENRDIDISSELSLEDSSELSIEEDSSVISKDDHTQELNSDNDTQDDSDSQVDSDTQGDSDSIIDSDSLKDSDDPILHIQDQVVNQEDGLIDHRESLSKGSNEFGFSCWLRFFSYYPNKLSNGLGQDNYFIGKITSKSSVLMSVWQKEYDFVFNLNEEKQNKISYEDIEGKWQYISFGYSGRQQIGKCRVNKEVRLISELIENQDFLRFRLGGKEGENKIFNGVFRNIIYYNKGGFNQEYKDEEQEMQELIRLEMKQNDQVKIDEIEFGEEYGWSGWLRWQQSEKQQDKNIGIRLSMFEDNKEDKLGSRMMILIYDNGKLQVGTYTYEDMQAKGNTNLIIENVDNDKLIKEWFWVYMGYRRNELIVKIRFMDGESVDKQVKNIKHYYSQYLYFYVGSDDVYQQWMGNIKDIKFYIGVGSYNDSIDIEYQQEDDKEDKDQEKDKNQDQDQTEDEDDSVIGIPVDKLREQTIMDADNEQKLQLKVKEQEYGYGYWYRFLKYHPSPNQHIDHSIILSYIHQDLLQVQIIPENYLFATLQSKQTIRQPKNIESLWTFIYFSYKDSKSIAILKYDNQDPQLLTFTKQHPPIDQIQLNIGNPSLNGQFANYALKIGQGAFIHDYNLYKKHLDNRIPYPQYQQSRFSQLINFEEQEEYQQEYEEDILYTSEEYSICGWIKCNNENSNFVWRLSLLKDDSSESNQEINDQLITISNKEYHFHTYSYDNGEMQQHSIPYFQNENELWHFVYFKYSFNNKECDGFILWIDHKVPFTIKQVYHYQPFKHYLFIQKDPFNKEHQFEGQYSSIRLNYGHNEQQVYDEPKYTNINNELNIHEQEQLEYIPVSYEEEQSVYEQTLQGEEYTGISEYSYQFWSKWLRSYPTMLLTKKQFHIMARLTTVRDHTKNDNTLSTYLAQGYYQFTTYTHNNDNLNINIKYTSLENQWTYISFSYKRFGQMGKAKAIVNREQQQMDALHPYIKDYLHFIIQKEFDYPLFNGIYANIKLMTGLGAFEQDDHYESTLKILQQLPVLEQTTIPISEEESYSVEDQLITEYSISGWFRLLTTQNEHKQNILALDDQFKANAFHLTKSLSHYIFSTYSCNSEDQCDEQIHQQIKYSQYEPYVWTYVYCGYKYKQIYSFIQSYQNTQYIRIDAVIHYIPTQITVTLGEITHRHWYLNLGQGAYVEKIQNENQDQHQGYQLFDQQNRELEIFEENFVEEIELDGEDDINGLVEYGYGYWSRFVWNWNKNKLLEKDAWVGMSRMTTNKDYRSDNSKIGDRTLAVWIGNGYYHFATYTLMDKQTNVYQNIDYDDMLDASWNYIFFYHTPKQTNAQIVFSNQNQRSIQFHHIIHQPIIDYVYFAFASSGKSISRYQKFNGQITSIHILLTNQLLQPDQWIESIIKPDYPLQPAINQHIEPTPDDYLFEFEEEFEGANEYSVALWFKWTQHQRPNWEVIFTLTYNEPQYLSNHLKAGDRVLSLFQYKDHRLFFSSHTIVQDKFKQVYSECSVQGESQFQWMYGYYAYKRYSLSSYLKTMNNECQQQIRAYHRVPKYFGLYVGKDNYHQPFHGQFKYLYLNSGEGSYRQQNYENEATYLLGFREIYQEQESVIQWSEETLPEINKYKKELELDLIGITNYGYGFWCQYLTAYPTRLISKPNWQSIARLTSNKDYQDMKQYGDRTLLVMLGRGFYHFATYNVNLQQLNTIQNVEYHTNLEGYWNYIYFSYSSSIHQATAFLYFSVDQSYRRMVFENHYHNPLHDYAAFIIGADFKYPSFNGIISNLKLSFGIKAYIHDVQQLKQHLENNVQPKLQHALRDKEVIQVEEMEEWNDQEYFGIQEYAIYGWFRYLHSSNLNAQHILMRLTNNDKSFLKDASQVGDRTLTVSMQQKDYIFATYNLGSIDKDYNPNIKQTVPFNTQLGLWTYFYFAYDWNKNTAMAMIKFPDKKVQVLEFKSVLHMVPNYLAFYVQSDQILKEFPGKCSHVGVLFGPGSYIVKNPEQLPFINDLDDKEQFDWNKEEIIYTEEQSMVDIEFSEELQPSKEYAIEMWTRWLFDFPTRLIKQEQYHSIFRLTNREKHSDYALPGDRVLAAWVARQYYLFSTYDKDKPNLTTNINYEFSLEGCWNYISFSYKDHTATAFILFPNEHKVSSQINDIDHYPITNYAHLLIAPKEFAYSPFHGIISNVKFTMGKVFHEPQNIPIHPKIAQPQSKQVQLDEDDSDKDYFFDQYSFSTSYSVSTWVRLKVKQSVQYETIFRLTINSPDIMKDNQIPGDRTLALFLIENQLEFGTYDYNAPLNIVHKINSQIDWAYVYFGYDWKTSKAYCYTKFYESQDSHLFEFVKHIIPNKFWYYQGNDNVYSSFTGVLSQGLVQFGDNSFHLKPQIDSYPDDYVLRDKDQATSALLGNDGLNSIKIFRNKGKSGKVEVPIGKSGKLNQEDGPISGQINQDDGPVTGKLNQEDEAASGQINQEDGPVSGQINQEDGPASGQINKEDLPVSGQINQEDGPVSGQINQEDQPVSGQINQEDGHISGQINQEDGPISGQINQKDGPISGQINQKDGPASGKIKEEGYAASGQEDQDKYDDTQGQMKNFNFMDGNLSLKIDEVSNNSMSISNKLRNQKRKEKGRGHKKRNRKYIRFDTQSSIFHLNKYEEIRTNPETLIIK